MSLSLFPNLLGHLLDLLGHLHLSIDPRVHSIHFLFKANGPQRVQLELTEAKSLNLIKKPLVPVALLCATVRFIPFSNPKSSKAQN